MYFFNWQYLLRRGNNSDQSPQHSAQCVLHISTRTASAEYNQRSERKNIRRWWPKFLHARGLCVIGCFFLKHTSDKKEKYGFEFAKDIIWWNWCQWQKRSSPLTLGSDVRYFRDFRHHWAEAKDALQLSSKWNCGSFKEGAYLFIYEPKEDFLSIADQQDNVFSGSYNFVDNPIFFPTFNTLAQSTYIKCFWVVLSC